MNYTHVMTIAGSDCSAGAGIQADLKTVAALGGYASTVITAVTSQNTQGVTHVFPVSGRAVYSQIETLTADYQCQAVKLGMLYSSEIVGAVAAAINDFSIDNIVCDPVMAAQGGGALAKENLSDAMIRLILPTIRLFTPNLDEAALFYGKPLATPQTMSSLCRDLAERFHCSVLLKGGHLDGGECVDVLYDFETKKETQFRESRVDTKNNHGTGCTLASAVAFYLASGLDLADAVFSAKQYITKALKHGKKYNTGQGNGPLHHFYKYW